MAESRQHWLDRNRPPRVQITYDVETGGAIEKKEIPFVVGVASDLSGTNTPSTKLKERKFVQLDRDTFNDVLASIEPKLSFAAENRLSNDGSLLKVELTFKEINDFRPESIVNNVPALKQLFDARTRLNDLLAKLEGNDDLNQALVDLMASDASLEAVREATKEPPKAST